MVPPKALSLSLPAIPPPGAAIPPMVRRPMATAASIAIFERVVRERLSKAALDALLSRAELLSEGAPEQRGTRRFFQGSTMLTLDLGRASHLFREACDHRTARRLAGAIAQDTGARNRIRAIATREAERLTESKVREVAVEIRVSSRDRRVLIDVDVEAVL